MWARSHNFQDDLWFLLSKASVLRRSRFAASGIARTVLFLPRSRVEAAFGEHTGVRGVIFSSKPERSRTMSFNVLIVEDQPLIALNLQDAVEELGHHAVGIAANMYQALLLSGDVDMALVDVNLEDGPTGPIVGRTLIDADVAVLFMTADPGVIRGGVQGAIGVIQKPIRDLDLIEAIQYVADRRAGGNGIPPPKGLIAFD